MIHVSVQHSKALPFHSSSQHLRSGHSGNCNCYWSSGKRRECNSTHTLYYLDKDRLSHCDIPNFSCNVLVLYHLHFLKHLGIFWFCPIFLVCKVFQRIPRICAAVILKWRLCSDTFFALIIYKKHMHCQKRLAVGRKPNSFSTAPSLWISTWAKRQLCRIQSFVKKITLSKQIYQLCPRRSKRTNLQSCLPELKYILTQKLQWIFFPAVFSIV